MAPSSGIVAAWIKHAAPLIGLLSSISLTTFLLLVLGFVALLATGYVPLRPFEEIRANQALILTRLAEVYETVQVCDRMDRRMQIIDCGRLTDEDLRRHCLE